MKRDQLKPKIGKRLQKIRRDRSQSLSQFAGILDVNPGTLSHYEQGLYLPGVPLLFKLRDRAGVDLNWLLTGAKS